MSKHGVRIRLPLDKSAPNIIITMNSCLRH